VLVVRAAEGFDGDVDERVRVPLAAARGARRRERRPMAMTDLDARRCGHTRSRPGCGRCSTFRSSSANASSA